MPLKPASTFIPSRAPIADKDGMATWSFIKILQEWDTKLRNGLNQIGQITQDIPATTKIVGRGAIGAILQFIDDSGQVLAGGVDFARDYLNKDTDHIADGTGSPLAGGKAAFIAFVGSHPIAGQTLRFDGTNWLPVAIAVTKAPTASEWLNGYDATDGQFTATQPAFADLAGQIDPSQEPDSGVVAGSYSLASITVDAKGRVTAASDGPAGISVTITTAALTVSGTQGSMTFVDGVLTAQVQAT